MQSVTVAFPSRAAYEAARDAVASAAEAPRDERSGPSVQQLDTQEALRALEAAR